MSFTFPTPSHSPSLLLSISHARTHRTSFFTSYTFTDKAEEDSVG